MFLIILNSDAELGLVKLTSEQIEVYENETEDAFSDYMFETTNGQVDLFDCNSNWQIFEDDTIEINLLGNLEFNSAKLETKQSTLFLTIE